MLNHPDVKKENETTHIMLNNSQQNPLTTLLRCAAVHPGLRSILLFDVMEEQRQTVTATLKSLLQAATGRKIRRLTFDAAISDEKLWDRISFAPDAENEPVFKSEGWLTEAIANSELVLIDIPDLAQLNLAAARNCVMLMGTDIVHVERQGQHLGKHANFCWIAVCKSEDVSKVSPHLLDRFLLRIPASRFSETGLDPVERLRKSLFDENTPDINREEIRLTEDEQQKLRQAVTIAPKATSAMLRRVLEYVPLSENYSPRRDLALARLATAVAQLYEAAEISVQHVDQAATLMGLLSAKPEKPSLPETRHDMSDDQELPASLETPPQPLPEEEIPQPRQPAKPVIKPETVPVYEPQHSEEFPESADFALGSVPYPEDLLRDEVQREYASLRFSASYYHNPQHNAHGPIIGVRPTKRFEDLAITATLLEAAKYQRIRKQRTPELQNRKGLIVFGCDLRAYRRAYLPDKMLVLLLDYTALRTCQWQDVLLPYLKWAYIERASVCLVQVGNRTAGHELRAEKILAKNVLARPVLQALETNSGKATPLAHGLQLALHTLRHGLQHGRNALHSALFLVLTDGRGNIPLENSCQRRYPVQVQRKGIEDALKVAERIRSLQHVETIIFNPQPRHYADLPQEFATRAGAAMIEIPKIEQQEVNYGDS